MARSRSRVAGSITAEAPPPDYQRDLPTWRPGASQRDRVRALAVRRLLAPRDLLVRLTTRGLIFSLIFLSFTIVTGIGGMVSLAQAAFVSGAGLLAGSPDHPPRLPVAARARRRRRRIDAARRPGRAAVDPTRWCGTRARDACAGIRVRSGAVPTRVDPQRRVRMDVSRGRRSGRSTSTTRGRWPASC